MKSNNLPSIQLILIYSTNCIQMLNIEKAASYEVLLYVQGIVPEENTMLALA